MKPTERARREALLDDAAQSLSTSGWCALPGFFPLDQTAALAREARGLLARGGFRAARVGRGPSLELRPDIRRDWVHWIDPHAPTGRQRAFLAQMEGVRSQLNAALLLGLFDFECHYAVYPPGAFYKPHVDRFAETASRTVSSILYLNEAWGAQDGGELRIFGHAPGEPHRDIRPQAGTLVLLLSAQTLHEVLPSRRERLSLAGWFRTRT